MQKQRVDILNGKGFQGTSCFESYRRMLISSAWTPVAQKSTFWIMREEFVNNAVYLAKMKGTLRELLLIRSGWKVKTETFQPLFVSYGVYHRR